MRGARVMPTPGSGGERGRRDGPLAARGQPARPAYLEGSAAEKEPAKVTAGLRFLTFMPGSSGCDLQ
ncbi:Hypothetical protein CAP_5077 [Chondromyces apiculatus DSM 436]|uniref:Uncharacterized protein n=1 Tax=Chondromyces apiculatus DSM 436 TaxID=1192034 RepID=A0A017T5W2_9BACT|nr:Hypothetical protein CAP_5077 [Chondromyces apiculatus DSM 436]